MAQPTGFETSDLHGEHVLPARTRGARWAMLWALIVTSVLVVSASSGPAQAGIFFNDIEYTYKEYWASHSTYTGGCGEDEKPAPSWYIEPQEGCTKEIELEIADDVQGAVAAVLYVNLWRNRRSRSARFTLNDGPQFNPNFGDNFSRSPFQATIPLHQLRQGTNVLKFQEARGPYHVHDVMVRVYFDADRPIIAGGGSDVIAPRGALTGVRAGNGPTVDPSAGGVLQVDSNEITLTATATDAAYVEFHAFYEGYDEDNDGVTQDWHNFLRHNWGPGGTDQQPTGATIGHIGTDDTAPYSVTWNLPHVVNQDDVRFKIRVVDAAGNVVEAPGGASAPFTLARSYEVEAYTSADFVDAGLFFDNALPQSHSATIDLPTDVDGITRAVLLGNHWLSPNVSINGDVPFQAYVGRQDPWQTMRRDIDPDVLVPGSNTIEWSFDPPGFGAMIEAPGPMLVIHRPAPSGPARITGQPVGATVGEGEAVTFSVGATGEAPLQFQWLRNGSLIPGANAATYTTPALDNDDDRAAYSVAVTNAQGTDESGQAVVRVIPTPTIFAAWWDTQWDYRVPMNVTPSDTDRVDAIVSQEINFSGLMRNAGAAGPGFDLDSIRVVEVDEAGDVIDAAVPFQFEPAGNFNPLSNAVGDLVVQLVGATEAGDTRRYFVYFDRESKGFEPVSFSPQVTRTDAVDEGLPAYRFDLADGSAWYYHHADGGGFSSLVDRDGADWIDWSTAAGSAGDFRGIPNAVKPPKGWMHPGRPGTSETTVLFEGPLRVTLLTTAENGRWRAIWNVYPTHADMTMVRADSLFWFLYEGVPGGEIDGLDFVARSDGQTVPLTGTFEADLPGEEWMYAADPADGRSLFVAHHNRDGSVDSFRTLDGEMVVLGFGRGGTGLNFPYLRRVEDGQPQKFTVGLADSTEFAATAETIRSRYLPMVVTFGETEYTGELIGPDSDDFSGTELDARWTLIDPRGDTTISHTGTDLVIEVPEGVSHDLWTNRDFAPRIMQDVDDTDLDVVVKFGNSPSTLGAGHGLILKATNGDWFRLSFDQRNSGTIGLYRSLDGRASKLRLRRFRGFAPQYMRVIRNADQFQFRYSWNGRRWFTLRQMTVPFELDQIGIVAVAHRNGTSPAATTVVDYFESRTRGTIVDDVPAISDVVVATTARSATVSWTTSTPSDTRIQHGPTINLGRRLVDDTVGTEHSVLIDYLDCDTAYFFVPEAINASGAESGELASFTTEPCTPLVSDDFSNLELGAHWTAFDPLGVADKQLSGTNYVASIRSGEEHNLFPEENDAIRLRQSAPLGDFAVQTKFESVLTSRFQMQGIVVEQDVRNFLRVEIHHDGSSTKAYIASVEADTPIVHRYVTVPTAPLHHLRLAREGSQWVVSHSIDDFSWVQVARFEDDLTPRYVGPYVGTTQTGRDDSPAFIGSIDYFFDMASPLVDDGGDGPDLVPPTISDLAVAAGVPHSQAVTVSWSTDELATSRVEWGTTPSHTETRALDTVAKRSHSLRLEPVACGRTYSFTVSSIDTSGNESSVQSQSFEAPACPAGGFSDNFDNTELDARWFVKDPRGLVAATEFNGLFSVRLPGATRHDLTPGNQGGYRLLQAVPNTDFVVEVGFESVVNFETQIQGVVFETHDANLVRFDVSSDGINTRAFVGRLGPAGGLSSLAFLTVPAFEPGTLRVTRAGTTWTFEYSADGGATWQLVYEGTITASVARFGPWIGNANRRLASVPEFDGLIDYVWIDADPIEISEPGSGDAPALQIWDDGKQWDGEPLRFGHLGLAQPDINVRGVVVDDGEIASLTYSVNGANPVRMGVGSAECPVGVSCTLRLATSGAFNADVPVTALNPGLNTVTIRALDTDFNVSTIDVPVEWSPGVAAAFPYVADWSTATALDELGTVIDGAWSLSEAGLEVDEVGYDRLFAVGDLNWTAFEAQVPITIHSFDPQGYNEPSGGPGVGFIPHWIGHTQLGVVQPKFGFSERLGALVWYRYRDDANGERLEIRDSRAKLVAEDLSGLQLETGRTYIFKLQADADPSGGPFYALKVWEQGTPEPAAWNIVTSLPPDAPSQGSLLLVAHHVDATFGELVVRELTASAPRITPSGGSFPGLVKVEMSSLNPIRETIRFTMDGTTPTEASPEYTGPFFLTETATIKARVFRPGFAPSDVYERSFVITDAPERVTERLQVLYTFEDGLADNGAAIVRDVSGAGVPLDLEIRTGSNATWVPGQSALRIDGESQVRTPEGANRLNRALENADQMTIEMWIDPADNGNSVATLFNLGTEGTAQNLTLSQLGDTVQSDLRTSATRTDGTPGLNTSGVLGEGLQHVVFVRRPNRTQELYVDGRRVWAESRRGALGVWQPGYALGLGNAIAGEQPWLGDLHLVAVYSDAFEANQVLTNFRAGLGDGGFNAAPVVDAGPDVAALVGESVSLAATAVDDGNPTDPGALTVLVAGPPELAIVDPTSLTTAVSGTVPGDYVVTVTVDDGEKSVVDTVTVTIVAPITATPEPTIDPASGSYPAEVIVSMDVTLQDAVVHYTTDGTTPTTASPTYTEPFVLTADTQVRAFAVRDGLDPSAEIVRDYVIVPGQRSSEGLITLYDFNEGSGTTVGDSAGDPFDLQIADASRVTWVDGGLRIDSPTVITNTAPMSEFIAGAKATESFTIELWVDPADIAQSDAMLLGVSVNDNARNVGVLQEGADLAALVRTALTDTVGQPGTTSTGVLNDELVHIVITRGSQGEGAVYIDGVAVFDGQIDGSFRTWAGTHRISLGGERNGSRSWIGTYYLVALYDRPLTDAEVRQHYAHGDV